MLTLWWSTPAGWDNRQPARIDHGRPLPNAEAIIWWRLMEGRKGEYASTTHYWLEEAPE